MIQYSSNGFYDNDRLAGGIIDLTQLGTSEEDDDEEEEIFHCEFCNNGRRMIQCKQDNNDISQGPLHKKGQYICPTCGNIKSPTNKKKGKKVPDWHVNQSLSLGFSVCLAIPFRQEQTKQTMIIMI